MASHKEERPAPGTGGRRRTLIGVIGGVVVLAVAIVLVIVLSSTGTGNGTVNAGGVIAPTAGAGEVLTPSDGPAAATGSPVASDPSQPDVLPAVPLTATATPVPGLQVSITGLAAVTGTANGIGEVSGPALQFTVTATNTGSDTVSLANTVVNVTSGAALTPANELTSASTPLPAAVAAGATATGTYVFTLAADQRSDVQISVDYQVGTPIVVFSGATP